jgi:hypothetical protein
MCKPKVLERPDQVTREIKLPPVQTMKRGTWECVVIVMPALAETEQADNPFVVTLIVRLKFALAKGVADRIDALGDVMGEEDAH